MTNAAHPAVICTVDIVLMTLQQGRVHVGLLRRAQAPFAQQWALPGGYIHAQEDESTQACAARVLRSKLGLAVPYLEQLATFSGPVRDPRGWSLAVAYCALLPVQALQLMPPRSADAADDATPASTVSTLHWVAVDDLPPLSFDHGDIVAAALARLRSKSQYSSMPVHLCAEQFTLPELQAVYEAVLGEPINKVSFRRKVDELAMLEPVPGALQTGGAHRPAQLYRVREAYRHRLSLSPRGL